MTVVQLSTFSSSFCLVRALFLLFLVALWFCWFVWARAFGTGCFDSVFRVLIALLCFLWVGDFSRVESRVFEMGMLCSDCWFFSSMQIPLQSF